MHVAMGRLLDAMNDASVPVVDVSAGSALCTPSMHNLLKRGHGRRKQHALQSWQGSKQKAGHLCEACLRIQNQA